MLGLVKGTGRHESAGFVPAIGFWKMFDNLRRTLSAPAAIVALLAGWTLPLPRRARLDAASSCSSIALPTLLPVARRPAAAARRHHACAATSARSARTSCSALCQTALLVAFLAHHAWLMVDAIGRTLFRLVVTQRRLLEWITAAQSKSSLRAGWLGLYRPDGGKCRDRRPCRALRLALRRRGGSGRPPFILAWLFAPAIARWVSLSPADAGSLAVSAADAVSLRLIARRTWRFFETFVTAADNMLPPDNFQEDPKPVVAHADVADQSRPLCCCRPSRPAISAGSERWRPSSGSRRRWPRWAAEALSRAFLQLVRHAAIFARSSRPISRRSTAEISPAI